MLDPACGSGNFLYIALRQLLSLEQEVINLAVSLGDSRTWPMVSPEQLHGIEINLYARELAQATIWIGYIQWFRENGYGIPAEPILRPLEAIQQMDAILDLTGFEDDIPVRRTRSTKTCQVSRAGVAGGGCDHRESAVFGREARCASSWATSTWMTCSSCMTAACRRG